MEGMLADSFHALLYHYLTELRVVECAFVIPSSIRNVAAHIHLARTVLEKFPAECLDARRKLRGPEVLHTLKGIFANRRHTIGDYYLGQTLTILEGMIRNATQTRGKSYCGQALAGLKGRAAYNAQA